MKIFEILECEEYSWQCSLGLFASVEAAMRFLEGYEIAEQSEDFILVTLPEYKDVVLAARHPADPHYSWYWWYSLPDHGATYLSDGTRMSVFYGIFSREVVD